MIWKIKTLALLALCALANAPVSADPLPAPFQDDDFLQFSDAEVALGQLLFYDPVLSGNRNISCATCHHPRFGTGDGVSLGLGEGGIGLGPDRRADPENLPEQRIPRNAPGLFNLGLKDIRVMFHDGRIELDPNRPSGLRTPLEDDMVAGFANLLSAQTMFPVLSADEMAGHYGENEISTAVRQGRLTGDGGAWDLIAKRVADIDMYQRMFDAAYPDIAAGRAVGFTDISNAIAAFTAVEWRATDTPFDRHLRGEAPLDDAAARGMALFFGPAGCSSCHADTLLSDQAFHAMGQPQLGPGKAARFESHQRDTGRMRVTGRPGDAYAFRTPALRNVALTGPWGHAGAFSSLEAFLRHHVDPASGLETYSDQSVLPEFTPTKSDWTILQDDAERQQIAAVLTRPALTAGDKGIKDLRAFLDALTDPISVTGRLGIPDAVPSGLPIDR